MAFENGDTSSNEATTSRSKEETNKGSNMNGDQQELEKSKEKEKANKVPFRKLFAFADFTDIMLMSIGSIGAIGNGVCMPIMAILFGDLTDSFGQNQNNGDVVDAVSKVSLKFVYLAIGAGIAAFMQVACWMVTGERQAARIRSLYLKTILRQDISFFDKETNTGEVVSRMSGDTVLIQDAMGEKVGKFLQLLSTFIGGFTIAFIKGWLLTLVMLSAIPPLVITGGIMAIMVSKMSSRGQNAYAKAATVVEQTIGSIRIVASFTGEKQAISNYNKFLVTAYKSGVHEGFAAGLGLGLIIALIYCSYALAVWFGGRLILNEGYTGGRVLNVIIAVLTGSMSLGQGSPCLSAFAAGQAAAFKMFETINRKPEIDAYDTRGKILDDIRGDIELRDVYFSYPARPDEPIFSGFSLSIPSGTTAALVGQSGSGKSTVVSLIERFYDPQAGATIEEIKTATELANAAKFIDKLPQGLNTMVGEHGTQLSGGQKQRIAIARAILKDPRILLLDEATSALDAESERVVQEALDRIMVNRTTVIVAHRLSTVRNADTIAVIHRGKMVEKVSFSSEAYEFHMNYNEELYQNISGLFEVYFHRVKDTKVLIYFQFIQAHISSYSRILIGAYSQLIRLQEVNKDSGQVIDGQNKLEISKESFRVSSQRMSLGRSISRGSSNGNSSRHSFSVSFGIPVGHNVTDTANGDPEDPPMPTEPAPEVSIRRLASLNKPEIPVILLGSISAIANGMLMPIFGILISGIIETFYKPHDELIKDTRFWSIIFVVFGVAALIANPAQTYFFSVAGCKLIQRIRSKCFEKVVHMEVGWFDQPEHSSGTIGARLSADAASVRALVGDALAQLVQNSASALAGLVIAFTASWQLAFIILAIIPLIGVTGYCQVKFLKGFSADAKKKYEEASQVANDAVGSIRTVASFCAEEKVMQLYKKKCDGPMETGIRRGLTSGAGFGLSFFLLFSVYATSFYAGARLVEAGKTTFTDVFRVFFALTMAALGISQTSSFAPDSTKAKGAAASIFAIIDRQSKIDSSDESGTTIENVKGEIELHHVSFKYPLRPDVQILRDLSLAIHAGKRVGVGNPTVVSLLQRFYDPDAGQITLDGVEIQKLKLKWLRQQMGLVSQEPALFNETIRSNIAYGKEGNATEAEILAASELANAHKFISSLQKGYDTMVGERGIQLSGGQKQRVAIARAIVKDPKILLLDEATSALDAESERVVQDALDRVMKNRTTVVVAHRLSTIKNADVIAVVKNGVIVEKGKHDTLINIEGWMLCLFSSTSH
ncbi:hypothetical protein Patl1_00783 [Pistacia atlantica]|uniref:Uncharacterized protein n=1 Tax=Pistacia atlantica TaxID=434234 RepID=A0ACC1C5U6_9ROSI|nr:hypothetical protein Patl1_00783 [Pistacia atlantica]